MSQQIQTAAAHSPGRSWLFLPPRVVVALTLAWLLIRWYFDAIWNLVPDEAYYWVWSRHLAVSYLDHPPMVAYLIRLGTTLLDNSELGVRCFFGITMAGTVLILWRAGRHIVADEKSAVFIAFALLVSPMVAVTGSIAAPDAPACFFQAAALATVLGIFREDAPKSRWIFFGIFLGLALDSKYTSVLLGLAIALALVSCPEGRRHLLTPWPWLAAIVVLLVFSPVVFWNASHHWASFRFQLHHGTVGNSPTWKNLLDYLGSQMVVCTPVLFVGCVIALAAYWKRGDNPMSLRILLFSATTPLVFFAISAIRRRVEGNWPMFAWFPAIMLFARYLGENRTRPRIVLAELAVIVAACMTIVLHAPALVWKISPKLGGTQWDYLYGWQDLATHDVAPLGVGSPIFTADYEYASELTFYLPDHPDVRPLSDPTRPTAFDFFDPQISPAASPSVVLVRRLSRGFDAPPPWQPLGLNYDYSVLNISSQFKEGRQIRRSLIEVAQRRGP
jgi:4-amino-4-deoxy-L-arabinose transferase-like glycosyltransferase